MISNKVTMKYYFHPILRQIFTKTLNYYGIVLKINKLPFNLFFSVLFPFSVRIESEVLLLSQDFVTGTTMRLDSTERVLTSKHISIYNSVEQIYLHNVSFERMFGMGRSIFKVKEMISVQESK